MKKLLLVLCMTACLFGLTACTASDDTAKADNSKVTYDEESYITAITSDFLTLSASTDEELEAYIENATTDGAASLIESWKTTKDEIGEINGFSDWTFTLSGDEGLEVGVFLDGSLHDVDLKIVFTEEGSVSYATFNVKYSTGEKMSKAAMNTIIGLCLVFVVLILISFIISLFKYINIFEQKLKSRKEEKSGAGDTPVDHTIAQIVQKEEDTNELELVAVIAAAIAASEGVSPDGLVVRTIRKVDKKRWQNG